MKKSFAEALEDYLPDKPDFDNMDTNAVINHLELDGTEKEKLEQYAEKLDSKEKGVPIARDLRGKKFSANGLCEWERVKEFINWHKHNVSFEVVSKIFEKPLPKGYSIEFDTEDKKTGYRELWIRISSDLHLVIVYQKDGSLIKLISADKSSVTRITKRENRGLQGNSLKRGPSPARVNIFNSLRKLYGKEGGWLGVKPDAVVVRCGEIHDAFINGVFSSRDTLIRLGLELDMTEKQAYGFVEEWQQEN